ncbi:MAG: RAMP superfamily CRISPR-associated protein [Fusobacteriaceae bacterium]
MGEFLKLENRLKITLNILPKSPLMIMLGRDKDSNKDGNYIPLLTTESSAGTIVNYEGENEKVTKDERKGEIYIPGSSIRGVFRNYFKDSEYENRVFGTTERRGRIHIGDAYFQKEDKRKEFYDDVEVNKFIQTRCITPIESFTGKAIVPLRFEYTKENFQCDITLNNVTRGELQKIYSLLRDSGLGEIRMGASKTRGFGEIEFEIDELSFEKYGTKVQFFDALSSYLEINEKKSIKIGENYLSKHLQLKNDFKKIDNENPNKFILELFKEVGDV